MPKKTLYLIIVLTLVTGVLIFLALTSRALKQPTTTQNVIPTSKPVEKTAKVLFNPQNVDLSTGTSTPASSVDILVDTGGAEISGVQVELQYDPKALTNVVIQPSVDAASFFSTGSIVLFNDVKRETGRVSYAIAISQGQTAKRGVGKIAALTFQKAFGAPVSTTVTFLDKTLVTILGENDSALKETVPLTVILSQAQAPYVPPTTSPSVTQ